MVKKSKSRTTVNVDAVKKDAKKVGQKLAQANPELYGKEVPSGSVRRESPLEQEMGSRYKKMIRDHNEKNKHILDRLPFQFPKKKVVRSHLDVLVACVECGYQTLGSEHTCGFSCPECKAYRRAVNPEAESRGGPSADDERVGIFGTASDLLELRERRRRAEDEKKEQ